MESMINNSRINSNGIDSLRPRKFKYYLSNSLRLTWLCCFCFLKKLTVFLFYVNQWFWCLELTFTSRHSFLQALSGDVIYFPLQLYPPSSCSFFSSSSSTLSCWSLATVHPVCLTFCKMELLLALLPSYHEDSVQLCNYKPYNIYRRLSVSKSHEWV